MKAIIISIEPKYVVDISNHKKIIEIRKTMPKCDLPIVVYIYCTKAKILGNIIKVGSQENSDLVGKNTITGINKGFMRKGDIDLQGKVVAKFTLNKVEEITPSNLDNFAEPSCLSIRELELYLWSNICFGYAWHIDNLVIFDEPKELSEFRIKGEYKCSKGKCPYYATDECKHASVCTYNKILTKAPQSWQFIEVEE